MTDDEKINEAHARYLAALHAMQSGVAMQLDLGASTNTTHKHLRVGINAAMSDHAALCYLLIEKGVITKLEYFRHMAKFMEQEKAAYEKELSEMLGKKVTLA